MAAQPFDECEYRGKQKVALNPWPPEHDANESPYPEEKSEPSRQQHRDERKLPGVSLRIDQKCVADPVQAKKKKTESETPPDPPRITQPVRSACCAVEHQDQPGIGQQQ